MKSEARAWAKAFGQRLRTRREGVSLTQEQVADGVGVGRLTYRTWEAGMAIPNSLHLTGLARMLGCLIGDLLEESEHEDPLFSIFRELEKHAAEHAAAAGEVGCPAAAE